MNISKMECCIFAWKIFRPAYVNIICSSIVVRAVLLQINHVRWGECVIGSKDNPWCLYMVHLPSLASII